MILEYIQNGIGPEDQKERRKMQRAAKFYIIDDKLYKKGFTQPLLKCLKAVEVDI